MTNNKKLTILTIPLNGHGHINACRGLCEELLNRKHKVIFCLTKEFAGTIVKHGFEERIWEPKDTSNTLDELEKQIGFWPAFVNKHANLYEKPADEQIEELVPMILKTMFDHQKNAEDEYSKIINEVRPDLIITDCYIACASIINSGIPWIWLFSASPHAMLMDTRIPPFYSGLPSNGDKKDWQRFAAKSSQALLPIIKMINDHCVAKGCAPFPERLHPKSPYLNIYLWPRELRYSYFDDFKPNIVGIDSLVRLGSNDNVENFIIPEILRDKPGKLILFSMGSFGCSNVKLMTRLVNILGKCPHRIIVAKGPLEYKLADNMWGQPFISQMSILPLVDLVITHGGNNTITETLYNGKKMLVMPTFFDQFDNAQRIAELGLGGRLDPFRCTETELLEMIEKLLDDNHLTKRLNSIGKRIRESNDRKHVADLIENILSK